MFRNSHRATQYRPARLPSMAGKTPSDEALAEASAWLARLHADDRDAADEVTFRAWLNDSPAHAAAFEVVDQVWSDVGGLINFRPGAQRQKQGE